MRAGRPKKLKLEQRIELARRHAAGESAKALSAAFGVSARHVSRLAKEERGDAVAVRDPSEVVAFRASQRELAAFDTEWAARGFANRSQALNAVLRGRCGFLDVGRDQLDAFCESWRQAKDVSDAARALARAVHRGKLALTAEDCAALVRLVDLAQGLSRELGRMKDAARARRGSGWPGLQDGALQTEGAERG